MPLHRNSGQWQLGLALSLVTAFFWGSMPNFLSIALQTIDTYTLTWFRFLSAFVILSLLLLVRGQFASPAQSPITKSMMLRELPRSGWLLLLLAIVGIGLDYPLYLLGMARTSPANAEVMIQLAPVLMGLGGIVIFKERYTRLQWLGVCILAIGFTLFFHEKLRLLVNASGSYLLGSSLVILAALAWAMYALAQKQLLHYLSSEMIMLIIYGTCTLLYTPFSKIDSLMDLDPLHASILILCGLSTLISYSAFAESLQHWEASKISAIQSLTPLITIATSWLLSAAWPALIVTPLTQIALCGIGLVIAGSATIALGQPADRPPQ